MGTLVLGPLSQRRAALPTTARAFATRGAATMPTNPSDAAMTYVVLARKWRPRTFEDLTGQQHVARTLQNAIAAERIPHAVLFTGARGVGKTSTARIFSMALNCEQGPTATPCGTCRACQEAQSGRSVDILEIDGASNRGINEIRELRDSVQYTPSRDRYKIYIIDEVHMLTTEAFNALLKTLEEPPSHVVFIFATTEPQKIPVTILSRCQRFDFKQIGLRDLVARLAHIASNENLQIEDEALQLIARQANGGMRDALSLLDQVISFAGNEVTARQCAEILGATDRRVLFDISDAIINNDAGRALAALRDVLSFGTDMRWFAGELAGHFRDLTVISVAPGAIASLELSDNESATAREQVARTSTALLETCLEIMVAAAEEIARSSFAVLRMELALIRMAELKARRSIDDVIALLEGRARDVRPLPESQRDTGGRERDGAPAAASAARSSSRSTSSVARNDQGNDDSSDDEPAPGPAVPSAVARPAATSVPSETTPQAPGRPTPEPHETAAATAQTESDSAPETQSDDEAVITPEPDVDHISQPTAPAREVDDSTTAQGNALSAESAPIIDQPTEEAPAAEKGSSIGGQATEEDSAGEPHQNGETAAALHTSGQGPNAKPAPARSVPLTAARWRDLIELIEERLSPLHGRALAASYARARSDATVDVAAAPALVDMFTERLHATFAEASEELLGVQWKLNCTPLSSWSKDDLHDAWHIAGVERDEEQARRQTEIERVRKHDVTHLLKETWPEAEFSIEYRPEIPTIEGNNE